MALQSLFNTGTNTGSTGSYPWLQQDAKKTIAGTATNPNVISGVSYNAPNYWVDEYGGNGELTGTSNWGSFFSGLNNLGEGYDVQDVQSIGGSNPTGFIINRADPNGDKNVYQQRQLTLNTDGTVGWADGSSWVNHTQQSQMDHFLSAGLPMALAMAGGIQALGSGAGAGVAGNGAFLGEGLPSGVGAWDAASGMFPTLPGYGTEVASLANAGGVSPFTGAAGGEVAGSGLIPGTGTTGLQLGGQAAGTLYGTGEGLALAPEAIGAASGGTGLGSMIGSTIPAGDVLGGLGGLMGGSSGVGSAVQGAASQIGKTGGTVVDNLLKNLIGGSSGGISNLGNLASLFTNYQQYNKTGDLINEIKSIYKPDGDYAKYMGDQLARKDAAAGRNSQYGPRLAQLMGILGDSQAKALSGLGGMMNTQQGGLNGMVGAGSRLAGGLGLGDLITQALGGLGSQGGMLVGEAGSTPSIWDRPSEDVDWESLFGG